MDAALPPAEVRRAAALINDALPPDASFHALRTRKAGARRFVEFHLLVPGTMTVASSHALCDRIEAALAAQLKRAQVTIHVEPRETQAPHE
jgi:divalent metal cation (Fe/Co/Zn/Cd) transporter